MNKKIIKNIVSIILFNSWILFLWVSDIMVFDQILKAEYYWYVWPMTIVFHLATIVVWVVLNKYKMINRYIFISCTALFASILMWPMVWLFVKGFVFDLNGYLVLLISSFVPAVIVVCSLIILIKSVICIITSSNISDNSRQ